MLMIKPGVRVTGIRPELLLAVMAAEGVYAEAGATCVVTACVDGTHKPGSLHYAGQAVDLRVRDVANADWNKLVARMRECLGEDYDVVLEKDHVHLEFDPKKPL